MGVTVINTSDAIDNVKDKLYSHQILAQSNLDIPKTLLLKHPIDVDFVNKHIGFPAIVKTISGSYGRGVFLAENKIIGARETHRIVIKVKHEQASPGKVIKKL